MIFAPRSTVMPPRSAAPSLLVFAVALALLIGGFVPGQANAQIAGGTDSDVTPRDDVEVQTAFKNAVGESRRKEIHALLGAATVGLAVSSGAGITTALVVAQSAGNFPFGEIQLLGVGLTAGVIGAIVATVLGLDVVMFLGKGGNTLLPLDSALDVPVASMEDAETLRRRVDEDFKYRLWLGVGIAAAGLAGAVLSAGIVAAIITPRLFGAAGLANEAQSLERVGLSVGALGLGLGTAAVVTGILVPFSKSQSQLEWDVRELVAPDDAATTE